MKRTPQSRYTSLQHEKEELRKSEERYRTFFSTSRDAVFITSLDGRWIELNDAAVRMFGYSNKQELMSVSIPDLYAKKEERTKHINKIVECGFSEDYPVKLLKKNGSVIQALITATVRHDKKGNVIGFMGTIKDITESRKVEDALKESELKLRTIYHSTAEGILVVQIQGKKFMQANKAICEMLGYTEKELLNLSIADIHPKESLTYVINEFYKQVKGEIIIANDIPVIRKDKKVFFADVSSSPISFEGKECLVGIFRDATKRRRAEEILKEHDLILRKLSANVPGMIYQFKRRADGSYCVPFTTDAIKNIFGCLPEDVVSDYSPIINVILQEDREILIDSIEASAKNMTQWAYEYRVQLPGMPVRWIYGTSTPEKLPDGSIIWHGFIDDITERKKAQEELRKGEEKFRLLAESAPDAIFIRSGSKFVYINKAALNLFGADSSDQLIGQPVMERFHPDCTEEIRERMRVLDEKKEVVPINEQKYLKLDGKVIDVEVSAVPFRYENTDGSLVFVRDITERKKLQKQQELAVEVLKVLNESKDFSTGVSATLKLIQKAMDVEVVAVRLHEGDDYPYFVQYGFTDKFVKAENYLCERNAEGNVVRDSTGSPVLDCMCGNVIRGRTDPGLPFFTESGSFWSNCTTELLVHTSEKERHVRTRNRCNSEGYESVALIPFRNGNKIIGLLQINDRRRNRFNPGIIHYLEMLATNIGSTLQRLQSEEFLKRSEERFKAQYQGSSIPTYTWQKKDEDFVLVDFNSAAETATEGNIRKYLNRSAGEMYRDRQDILRDLHRCFEEKISIKKSTPSEHFMPGKFIIVTYSFVPSNLILVQAEDITERKRMEEELLKSEEKFRAVFENSAAAIALINPDETIEDVNEAYLLIGGYARDEVVGRSWIAQVIPEDLERMKEFNRRRLSGERDLPEQYEFSFKNGNGEKRYAWVSVSVIPTTGKIIASFVDITERKQMEESLRQKELMYRNILENIQEGYFEVDLAGNFKFFNDSMCLLYGYSKEELAGMNYRQYVDKETAKKLFQIFNTVYKTGEHIKGFDWLAIRKDGTKIYVETSVSLDKDSSGKTTGFRGVVRDVTERKKAEEDILLLNVELEKRVRLRTAELMASNKELESFSYSVSHDLRAPLRHIIGFSEILQNTAVNLDEKSLHCLNNIVDSTKRMGELIDDLLSFSRMGRVELRNAGINVEKLIRDVIKELCEETQGRNIVWDINPLPIVTGDAAMLRIVFMNLIANAVKFTRLREEVRITIGSFPSENKERVFFVRDNGVGFDMKYVDKLFGVFQRLHSRRDFEGTGIGLANVRMIVERHGGKVWAEGATDNGATFYVSLPTKEREK